MALSVLHSVVDSLDVPSRARFDTFSKLLGRLQNFDEMEMDAARNSEDTEELNEKLHSILNEKTNFLSDIGIKESDLRIFLEKGSLYARDIADKTTFEEISPFLEKMIQEILEETISDSLEHLLTAIDIQVISDYVKKLIHKLTPPAC